MDWYRDGNQRFGGPSDPVPMASAKSAPEDAGSGSGGRAGLVLTLQRDAAQQHAVLAPVFEDQAGAAAMGTRRSIAGLGSSGPEPLHHPTGVNHGPQDRGMSVPPRGIRARRDRQRRKVGQPPCGVHRPVVGIKTVHLRLNLVVRIIGGSFNPLPGG